MTVLKIVQLPDPILRRKVRKVLDINDEIRTLVNDMYETMYAARGVGLAANQVGKDWQIFTMDVSQEGNQPICAINPEIISRNGTHSEDEGCLSVAGAYDRITRSAKVHMRALDIHGKPFELHADDLMAKCIQHEVDHLNGVLYIDHLSKLKQDRIKKKIEKYKQRASS
jgi:peptide deformylase